MRFVSMFAVDLALSHEWPKWRLIKGDLRLQPITIVFTVMTVRNKHNQMAKFTPSAVVVEKLNDDQYFVMLD